MCMNCRKLVLPLYWWDSFSYGSFWFERSNEAFPVHFHYRVIFFNGSLLHQQSFLHNGLIRDLFLRKLSNSRDSFIGWISSVLAKIEWPLLLELSWVSISWLSEAAGIFLRGRKPHNLISPKLSSVVKSRVYEDKVLEPRNVAYRNLDFTASKARARILTGLHHSNRPLRFSVSKLSQTIKLHNTQHTNTFLITFVALSLTNMPDRWINL